MGLIALSEVADTDGRVDTKQVLNRYYLREARAALAVIAMIAGLVLLFSRGYASPERAPERMTGQIVGFHGYLLRSQFNNVTLGSVRLADGRIVNVRWPERRARHCRKGDHVELERYGARLRVAGDGCLRK
jgi:hypothetical protein